MITQGFLKAQTEELPKGWHHPGEVKDVRTLVVQGEYVIAGGHDGVFKIDQKTLEQVNMKDEISKLRGVNDLLTTNSETLWIATTNGIYLYDQKELTHFTESDGLPDNRVNLLKVDRNNTLWIGTWKGLAKWDGEKFIPYDLNHKLSAPMVSALHFDVENNMWVGSAVSPKGGLTIITKNQVKTFSVSDGLIHNNINCIMRVDEESMWVGTGFSEQGGLEVFKKIDNTWRRSLTFSVEDGIAGAKIRSLYSLTDRIMCIGTENDGVTLWKEKAIRTITSDDGLRDIEVKVWIKTDNGSLWLGSRKGITTIDNNELLERAGE